MFQTSSSFSFKSSSTKTLRKKKEFRQTSIKSFRSAQFTAGTMIMQKEDNLRYIYQLRRGQAWVVNQNQQQLFQFQQGDYLNIVESCMQMSSPFKNIKAIKKCQILLVPIFHKFQQREKKKTLITQMETFQFHEISLFADLPYALTLQLARYFFKITVSRKQVNNFLEDCENNMVFLVHGAIEIQGNQNKLRMLKIEKGQILNSFYNKQKYKFLPKTQNCNFVYINKKLFFNIIGHTWEAKFASIIEQQRNLLKHRQKSNRKLSREIKSRFDQSTGLLLKSNGKQKQNEFINPIKVKYEHFNRARSIHYSKIKKDFRSYSDEKRKLMKEKEQGYKLLSQFNKKKYAKNYNLQKQDQINKEIYALKFQIDESGRNQIKTKQSMSIKDMSYFRTMSNLKKMLDESRAQKKKSFSTHNFRYTEKSKKYKSHNLSLQRVQDVRKSFEKKNVGLYKICKKRIKAFNQNSSFDITNKENLL